MIFKKWDEIIPMGYDLDVHKNHGKYLNYKEYDDLIKSDRILHIDARSK